MAQLTTNQEYNMSISMKEKEIATQLNAGDWEPLYTATEDQISNLIDEGEISEDFYSRHQEYSEEMRCMMADAVAEFS